LTDTAEELIQVGLHPTAAELDDGDYTTAGEARRPIIRLRDLEAENEQWRASFALLTQK
jgi:hypothetical protein